MSILQKNLPQKQSDMVSERAELTIREKKGLAVEKWGLR